MTTVETLKRALERLPSVRLAVLYGSAAKGRFGSRSDFDVGLSLDPGSNLSGSLQVTLERITGRRVDLVVLDEAPPLLRMEIAKTGRVLVERHAYLWAEFRAHAMIDWWDWAPTAQMMHRILLTRLKEESTRGPS